MKKLLMVLTFAFMTLAACFGVEETLRLTANVPEKKPEFIMKGGFAANSCTTQATQAGALLASNVDISTAPITVYVEIFQVGVAKYKKSFTLTVTATALTHETDASSSTDATAATSTNINTARLAVTGSASNNVATFSFNYKDGKPVNPVDPVGTASFTWAADDNLLEGNYSASIIMEYTAP